MKDDRDRFSIWIAALKRNLMWHFLNKRLNLVLVSEFPKSGGSWFCQMLSDALEIPFPRNKAPQLESCILHGHYVYHHNYNKVVCVMRDGRDVMVSAYFHFLFGNDINPSYSTELWRQKMPFSDYENIQKNLPAFMEYMFNAYRVNGRVVRWSDFVKTYYDNSNAIIVKYENLLNDPLKELQRTIKFLSKKPIEEKRLTAIIDKYSFRTQTNRKAGEEDKNSFLRKGIAGDWKNQFSKEACMVFDRYAGEELILAGYESTREWYQKMEV